MPARKARKSRPILSGRRLPPKPLQTPMLDISPRLGRRNSPRRLPNMNESKSGWRGFPRMRNCCSRAIRPTPSTADFIRRLPSGRPRSAAGCCFLPWSSISWTMRRFRPHLLSEELERLLHEKEVTGPLSWMRLFDETIAGLRIPVAGEELTLSLALDRLSHPERAVREAAGRAIGETFQRHIRLFSLIINTLAKDKHIVDTWRRYSRPVSYRNLSNVVEDEVVDALAEAVAADYGRLSHRYYALKAKWLGLPKLQHWDRNAPLSAQEDRHISWQ